MILCNFSFYFLFFSTLVKKNTWKRCLLISIPDFYLYVLKMDFPTKGQKNYRHVPWSVVFVFYVLKLTDTILKKHVIVTKVD